jgi:hypothetical protein
MLAPDQRQAIAKPGAERMNKQTSIPGDAEPKAVEMNLDELDAVKGGGKVSDIIDSVVDRVVAIYHFVTGTITSHATTLP